ncbi:DUF3068 domain-containing protein [Kibdelosporangium lantanae]|uniref:DUF3068 domain-containing protein n=1 Tax=Kibdelosporangium lantanae TaxID=1497396 RepID=A0ABW3MEY0_9PSEU
MRRVLSFAVLGLGVFGVAAGLFLRLYAYPALAKVPHNPNTTAVAQGSGITALVYVPTDSSSSELEIRHNMNLTSVTYVSGDMQAPEVKANGNVTSWIEATEVTDDRDRLTVSGSMREVCMDRFTAEAVVPCTNQYLEATRGKKIPGAAGQPQFPGLNFKFPFGTEKRTYPWYDLTLGRTVDAKFQGEDQIQGVPVYRFGQTVPATVITTQDVPGSLVGRTDATVKADLYYQVERTLWIEPATGALVNLKQSMKQELRAPGESSGTVVFDGTLGLNQKTVDANVKTVQDNKSKLWLLTGLPVYLWIVGGVLTLAGVILVVALARRRSTGA